MILNSAEKLQHAILLSGGTVEDRQTYVLHVAKKLLCENRTRTGLKNSPDTFRQGAGDSSSAVYTKVNEQRRGSCNAASTDQGIFETSSSQSCEKCRGCLWVEKLSHPDLLLLPIGEAIKIEEVRLISHHLHQTSHQGKSKIVLLSKADSMPIGAVNALLKTLEEPPPHSYIFLFSDYPHLLPATLRSRCQKIRFPTLRKSSSELISALIETLKALKKGAISAFEGADRWKNHPMIELLDGLYYCLLESKTWRKSLFIWQDYLNSVRRQVLNKQHPNHLLALEHLFYQWTKLVV